MENKKYILILNKNFLYRKFSHLDDEILSCALRCRCRGKQMWDLSHMLVTPQVNLRKINKNHHGGIYLKSVVCKGMCLHHNVFGWGEGELFQNIPSFSCFKANEKFCAGKRHHCVTLSKCVQLCMWQHEHDPDECWVNACNLAMKLNKTWRSIDSISTSVHSLLPLYVLLPMCVLTTFLKCNKRGTC